MPEMGQQRPIQSRVPLLDPLARSLCDDVLNGLGERQKAIPARWFYDLRGSQLFEQITRLPEYYLTRSEIALLEDHADGIAAMTGPGRIVVEFGSGSSLKTPLLLRAVTPRAYVPIDISGDFLRMSSRELTVRFPALPIEPIEADFMHPVALPPQFAAMPALGFFPGSTIGNMVPATAVDLLRSMRMTLGSSAHLLIGFDRTKPVDVLLAAYDDAQGVTAQFNLNLLHRIKRELGSNIPVGLFRHAVRWNHAWSRIEMHLVAGRDLSFAVCGHAFSMARGETIHTENSHKYTPEQARMLLQAGGWTPLRCWTGADETFLIVLAEASEHRSAP
jgi:dimethylhistidine N-methyltransferase